MAASETAEARRASWLLDDADAPADLADVYEELMRELEGEFERVVAAMETRLAAVTAHDELREAAAQRLRDELWDRGRRVDALTELVAMAHEDHASRLRETHARHAHELAEHAAQRADAEAKLATTTSKLEAERRVNAELREELTRLHERVDRANRGARQLEERLQEIERLKRAERRDLEADVAHLERRLADQLERNQQLAEALLDKDELTTMHATRHWSRHDDRHVDGGDGDLLGDSDGPGERRRRHRKRSDRSEPTATPMSTGSNSRDGIADAPDDGQREPVTPALSTRRHSGSADSTRRKSNSSTSCRRPPLQLLNAAPRAVVDAPRPKAPPRPTVDAPGSHAPTVSSPEMTPPTTPRRPRPVPTTDRPPTGTRSSRALATGIADDPLLVPMTAAADPSPMPEAEVETTTTPTVTPPSARLQRELCGLRRKLEACMPLDEVLEAAP